MGCPDIYYKKALQLLACRLNYLENEKKAIEMYNEEKEDILKKEILEHKDKLSEKKFYFMAGRVLESVLNDADINDGCDGFNACCGGLNSFQSFIGIKDKK